MKTKTEKIKEIEEQLKFHENERIRHEDFVRGLKQRKAELIAFSTKECYVVVYTGKGFDKKPHIMGVFEDKDEVNDFVYEQRVKNRMDAYIISATFHLKD